MGRIIVERKDTGVVVGSIAPLLPTPFMLNVEAQRAARFAAWRFGATCWARDGEGGRVLHVAEPVASLSSLRTTTRNCHGEHHSLVCCWPGCPESAWVGSGREELLRAHMTEPHVLCSCGRFFRRRDSFAKHRGQMRRTDRFSEHPNAFPIMRLRQLSLLPAKKQTETAGV